MISSYPWYISDWRSSETRLSLTLAQRGLYRELLDYCYLEGSLPSDRALLAQIAGTMPEAEAERPASTASVLPEHSVSAARARFGHNLSTVLALFEYNESTKRYHHAKVDEVLAKLVSYHEQKKHAGAKSGKARRERALNGRSAEKGTDAEPSPSPAPEPTPAPDSVARTPTPIRPKCPDFQARFESLYALHPVPGFKPDGIHQYLEILSTSVSPEQVADAIDRSHADWAAFWESNPTAFQPGIGMWFSDGYYLRKPRAREPTAPAVKLTASQIALQKAREQEARDAASQQSN